MPVTMGAPSTPRRRMLRSQTSEEKAIYRPVRINESPLVDSTPPAKRPRAAEGKGAPPEVFCLDMATKTSDPPSVAPTTYPLVGRETECKGLDDFLLRSLAPTGRPDAPGGSIYVSGGPGTGKTCCVRAACSAWNKSNAAQVAPILEVNCMELTQRSPVGLLQRLAQIARSQTGSAIGPTPKSATALVAHVAEELARLGSRIIIIADEVDQIVGRRSAVGCSAGHALEPLFSLTRARGGMAIAIFAIANSVDLLQNGDTLLFQPYAVDQLRQILKVRLDHAGDLGAAAAKALGPVAMELRIRQFAKRSGDCRQVVCFCEEALFQAAAANAEEEQMTTSVGEDPVAASTPQKKPMLPRAVQNDPLNAVCQLPHEQQVLLCALANASGEAVRFTEVCMRYKDLSRQLHRPADLASRDQVSSALGALEQRGLLSVHAKKAGSGKRTLQRAGSKSDSVVELAVSCKALKEKMSIANPTLEKCLQ